MVLIYVASFSVFFEKLWSVDKLFAVRVNQSTSTKIPSKKFKHHLKFYIIKKTNKTFLKLSVKFKLSLHKAEQIQKPTKGQMKNASHDFA